MSQFKKGDESSLEVIIRRYESPLIGFLITLTRDDSIAQDLCQEVFLRLIRRPPGFLHGNRLKPWLFQVARNLALDEFRRTKGAATVSLDEDDQGIEGMPEGPIRPTGLLHSDDVDHLLERLTPELKEVVALRIFADLTFKEIAKATQTPLGTVLWRMKRALGLLREELENENR